MKLSIIIPVYNTAPFLKQHLDSILSQVNDKQIELIIVNDGSTDHSKELLDDYAQKYSTIKLFHRSNEGVYPARNFAIGQSSGAYIWMLDSDDYLLDGALDRIYQEVKENPELDILNLGYQIEYRDQTLRQEHAKSKRPLCTGIEYLQYNFGSFFLWRNVYKRSFLESHRLQFDAKVFSLEDTLFNIRAYSLAEKIKVFTEPFYFYRYNVTSISKKPSQAKKLKRADSSIYVHTQLRYDLNQMDTISARYQAVLGQLNFSVMGFFYSLIREGMSLSYLKKVYKIYFKEGILPIKGKEPRWKLKLFKWAINNKWSFNLMLSMSSNFKKS